jgi:TonB family protein
MEGQIRSRVPDTVSTYRIYAFAISIAAHALLLVWVPVAPHRFGSATPGGMQSRVLHVSLMSRTDSGAVLASTKTPVLPVQEQAKSRPPESPVVPRTFHDADAFSLAPNYYPAHDLSQMPAPLGSLQPKPVAGDEGIGGKLSIRLWIDAAGKPDHVSLLESELPSAFADAVLDAFRNMHFIPGKINGTAVPAWVDIEVEYRDIRAQSEQQAAAASKK